VRAGEIVVVSPHFDDAVLSTAGLLVRRNTPATIVTVFAGLPESAEPVSDWDRLCGFDNAQAATQTRASEDRDACRRLGLTAIHLSCVEGVDDLQPLRDLVSSLPEGTVVWLPAGIGGHHGHTRVRDAALTAAASGPVYVYADLPYAANLWHWGHPEFTSLDGTAGLQAVAALKAAPARAALEVVRLSAIEWARKRDAVWAYASQLGPLSLKSRALMACPGPLQTEALWQIR
jgi:LmbE family N-acetylglucosaminyl deacetylase